jgi:hypothetical protein
MKSKLHKPNKLKESYILNICNRRISFAMQKCLARQSTTSPSFSISIIEDLDEVLWCFLCFSCIVCHLIQFIKKRKLSNSDIYLLITIAVKK